MFFNKKILLKSGNGGNGCISYFFLKNKFYADGGDGGDGGDVFLLINNNFKIPNINIFFSNNGLNGKKNIKTGAKGKDENLKLPIGICILLNKKKIYIATNNIFIKLIKGGKGGKGNYHYRKFFNSKVANIGKKGKIFYIDILYRYFINRCYVNISNFFTKNNIFNYKNNFISKIYIFYINIIFFKIFYKIIKFFLYFLYIKNLTNNNYWIIIDGIEKIKKIKKIKKINYIITPYFIISTIFNIGIKKFFHYINLWKNS